MTGSDEYGLGGVKVMLIMLSSKDGLFDHARGRIVGSEQYLTKLFTREQMLDAIEQHVLNGKH